MSAKDFPGRGKVAVLKATPETVLDDYSHLMHMAGYQDVLSKDEDLIIKLNLSWTKFFPACSTPPWQLEGAIKALLVDGYQREKLYPVENKTVVTNPRQGAINNRWMPILQKYGLPFIALPKVEWVKYEFKGLLKLDQIFPEIEIPKMFIGKSVLHLPTVKCLLPGTEVVLADGSLVTIGELVEEAIRRADFVLFERDGDMVVEGSQALFSLSEEGEIVPSRAYLFWKTPIKGEKAFTIVTKTGREIKASKEHPFLTPRGWVKASALRVGERIAIPRVIEVEGESQPLPKLTSSNQQGINLNRIEFRDGRRYSAESQKQMLAEYLNGKEVRKIEADHAASKGTLKRLRKRYGIKPREQRNWDVTVPEKTSPEFWRWLGYFLAEGCVDENDYFCFVNSDPRIQRDYLELTKKLFNVETDFKRGKDSKFRSIQLREWFEKLGLPIPLHTGNKRVPQVIFKCPNEEIANFLQGYFEGDGCLAKCSGEKKRLFYLYVVTKSERLAKDIQYLLSRLGVASFRHMVWSRATNTGMEKHQYHTLSIYSHDLATLANYISFVSEHKQRHLDRFLRGKRNTNWDTIPIPPDLFRRVRDGLGLPRRMFAKRGVLQAFEEGWRGLSRSSAHRYIEILSNNDIANRFEADIAYMRFLANDEIAWDHIVEIREEVPKGDYFYDFSVEESHNFVAGGVICSNTHGHSIMTLAIKNAFGGLLKEVRHYAHEFIHEVLVDLLTMQYELHPGIFAVADGTVCGDGAGPRTMRPVVKNYILASADQVAIDAIAAKMMGFDPLKIPYLRMAAEMGYGVADPKDIEVIGEDISAVDFGFESKRSFVIWGDQMIRKGFLRPFYWLLLKSPLWVWAPFASNIYHDLLWYPTIGRRRIKKFMETEWGKLFRSYR